MVQAGAGGTPGRRGLHERRGFRRLMRPRHSLGLAWPLVHPARCGHDRRVALPAGFVLVTEVFDPAASEAHFRGLLAEIDWEEQRFTIYGRTMPMPRLVAMYGPVGYRYSGIVHPSRRLAPRLEVIRRRVEAVTGRVFNSVLANLYRDGRDSVGWHRDSDYAHGGQPDIASVSFGASRRFELSDRAGARAAEDLASGACCSSRATPSRGGGTGCRRRAVPWDPA